MENALFPTFPENLEIGENGGLEASGTTPPTTPPRGGRLGGYPELRTDRLAHRNLPPIPDFPDLKSEVGEVVQKRHGWGYLPPPPRHTDHYSRAGLWPTPPRTGVGRPQDWGLLEPQFGDPQKSGSRSRLLRFPKLRFLDTPPEGWVKLSLTPTSRSEVWEGTPNL
jgi:hypothetical protein